MAVPRGPLPAIVAAAAGIALGAGAGALVVALVGGSAAAAPAAVAPTLTPGRLGDLLLDEADAAAIPPGSWKLVDSSTATIGELVDPAVAVEPAACAELSLALLPAGADTPVATALAQGGLADGDAVVQHRLEWFPDAEAAAAAFAGVQDLFAECAETSVTAPGARWADVQVYGLVAVDPGGDGRLPTVELERKGVIWGERIVFQLAGNVVSSLTLPTPVGGWVAQRRYDEVRARVDELLSTPVPAA